MDKGKKLFELRCKAGLSQVDAASKVGVTKQTLYKYEKGIVTNIPSDVIERLAKLYGSSPQEIMGWEDRLIDATVKNLQDQKFLERYHNASPETRNSVDLLIEADLRKHGLLD